MFLIPSGTGNLAVPTLPREKKRRNHAVVGAEINRAGKKWENESEKSLTEPTDGANIY